MTILLSPNSHQRQAKFRRFRLCQDYGGQVGPRNDCFHFFVPLRLKIISENSC